MYSDPPTAPNLSSRQIWTVAPHGQQRVHSSCRASSFCKVIGSCQVQLWEAGRRKGGKKWRERREVTLYLLPQPTHPVEWERTCYHENSLTCYMSCVYIAHFSTSYIKKVRFPCRNLQLNTCSNHTLRDFPHISCTYIAHSYDEISLMTRGFPYLLILSPIHFSFTPCSVNMCERSRVPM